MKVVCSMIVTANGYIADDTGKSVSSKYNWDDFFKSAKRYNNFVIGRKTLDIVGEGFKAVECAYKVVVSKKRDLVRDQSFIQAYTPEEVIATLKGKVDTIFLVGGGEINASFAQKKLLDEVELTIEPRILGNGINVFSSQDFDMKLRLENIEKLAGGRIRVTYTVLH